MECRVEDVLVRLGQQKRGPGGHVEQVPPHSPRDQPVQRADRDLLGHAEQPQVEHPDGAEQHAESDEMQALGDRPGPLGTHQRRDAFDGGKAANQPELQWLHKMASTPSSASRRYTRENGP